MLIKLLKYDLKYMLKNMSVFYILSIFFAITTRISFGLDNQSVIVKIISQLSVGCMFALVVNIMINTIMRSWVRFRDSIYKDESYLTHTLPVTKKQIYNSKFIQTLIFSIIGFIIIIISLLIAYYTQDRWTLLKEFISNFTLSMNFNTNFFIIGILLILFLEIFNALQCGYLGILLGYQKNNNKIFYSILYGIISYFITQLMVLLLIFLVGLFNSNIMNLFKNNIQLDINSIKKLGILAIVFYTIIICLTNTIAKKIFSKGVNIE